MAHSFDELRGFLDEVDSRLETLEADLSEAEGSDRAAVILDRIKRLEEKRRAIQAAMQEKEARGDTGDGDGYVYTVHCTECGLVLAQTDSGSSYAESIASTFPECPDCGSRSIEVEATESDGQEI